LLAVKLEKGFQPHTWANQTTYRRKGYAKQSQNNTHRQPVIAEHHEAFPVTVATFCWKQVPRQQGEPGEAAGTRLSGGETVDYLFRSSTELNYRKVTSKLDVDWSQRW
jgi:hypothetical protein